MGLPQRHNPIFSSHHSTVPDLYTARSESLSALSQSHTALSEFHTAKSESHTPRPINLPAFRKLTVQLPYSVDMAAPCPTGAISKALGRSNTSSSRDLSVNPTAPSTANAENQPSAPRNSSLQQSSTIAETSSHLTTHEDGSQDEQDEEDELPNGESIHEAFQTGKSKTKSLKSSTPQVSASSKSKAKAVELDQDDELPFVPIKTKRKAPVAMAAPDAKKIKAAADDQAVVLGGIVQATRVATETVIAQNKAMQEFVQSTVSANKTAAATQAEMWSSMLSDHRESMKMITQTLAEQCKSTVAEITAARVESIDKIRSFYVKAMTQLQKQMAIE